MTFVSKFIAFLVLPSIILFLAPFIALMIWDSGPAYSIQLQGDGLEVISEGTSDQVFWDRKRPNAYALNTEYGVVLLEADLKQLHGRAALFIGFQDETELRLNIKGLRCGFKTPAYNELEFLKNLNKTIFLALPFGESGAIASLNLKPVSL